MSTATVSRAAAASTLRDTARLTALVGSGLLAGAVVAIWLFDAALDGSAALYIEYRQATTAPFTRTLPPLGGLALLAAVVSAVLGRGRGRALALSAAACFLAGLAVTVVVHFPLNGEILTWSAVAPPAGWQQVRDRWATAHTARTLLAVAAFVLLALDRWRGRDSLP